MEIAAKGSNKSGLTHGNIIKINKYNFFFFFYNFDSEMNRETDKRQTDSPLCRQTSCVCEHAAMWDK